MTIHLTPCVHVTVSDDRPTTLALVDWMMDNHVYPVRGAGGSCGPDFYNGIFEARDHEALEAFFATRRPPPRPVG